MANKMPHYITKESRWRDQADRADQESQEDAAEVERAIAEETEKKETEKP